jgi:hypothetical protein
MYNSLRVQSPDQDIGASWLPNCSTPTNEVYFRLLIIKSDNQSSPERFPMLTNPTPQTATNNGYVHIPTDYSLSFDIEPLGLIESWGSIIHFTQNGQDSSRLPGIWFHPNTNELTIRFSGTGFNNIKIPFGVASNIQINAVGLKVEVMVNEVKVSNFSFFQKTPQKMEVEKKDKTDSALAENQGKELTNCKTLEECCKFLFK